MSRASRLEFFPAKQEIHTHHLLQVSGVAFRENFGPTEILCALDGNDGVACAGRLILVEEASSISEILKQNKERTFLLFEVSDLGPLLFQIKDLLKRGYQVDLLFHKPLSEVQLCHIEELENLRGHLRLIYLESKLVTVTEVFATLPASLQGRIHFCYLPKVHSFDCLLDPTETIERIELRKQEAAAMDLELQVLILKNSDMEFANSEIRKFYEEPNLDNYMTLLHSKNRWRYYFLKGVQKFGFAAIFGFLMWVLKVLLNPFAYEVRDECKGWLARFAGFVRGGLIDFSGALKRFTVEGYWTVRRFKDLRNITLQSLQGQIKIFFVRLYWGLRQGWKIRVALMALWGEVRRISGESWGEGVRLYWHLRSKIQIRMTAINTYWKLRHLLVTSFTFLYWRTRHVGTVVFTFLYWRTRHVGRVAFTFLYWQIRHGMRRLFFFLTYPVFKVYWFVSYQYKKRVVGKIHGNESHDL